MLKLKALLLSEGMHGMISQTEGLAKALGVDFRHEKIKLKNIWNYLPPSLTPISLNILEDKFISDCKIIISCGRKSVIPSIALKKKFKKQIFNIHIQDPKVSISHFDAVICPEHDDLNGENVFKTTGAIHYLTPGEIRSNLNYLKVSDEKKIITYILGGPNKYYDYSDKEIDKVFNQVKNLFTPDKYKIIVIPSYRTPENIIKKAFSVFSHDHLVIKNVDKKAYLSSLGQGEIILVMCDSISMISEAAITGKPIYVVQMITKKKQSSIY